MGWLPGDCVPKTPDLTKGTRKILDAVMNGKAFKNPQSGLNGSIGNNTTAAHNALGDEPGLQDRLAGINDILYDFRQHTNKLSGKGSQSDFSKIFGVAGAYNDAKEQVEKGKKDHFQDMFGGLVKGGKKMEEMDSLTEKIKLAAELGNITEVTSLMGEAEDLANNLKVIQNGDNSNLEKALGYVVKKGLGEGIASTTSADGNCFGASLFKEFIASDTLNAAIAVNELPERVQQTIPDQTDVDMDQILDGITGSEAEDAAAAQRAYEEELMELRLQTIESTLAITSAEGHDHVIKVDGGSYGAIS
jgi:hypothetical protein